MASMMRYERDSATVVGDRPARAFARNTDGLAAFRAHARADHNRSLTNLIESEIIPRLMIAHATEPSQSAEQCAPASQHTGESQHAGESHATIDAADIEYFAPMAMQVEADALLAYIESILARGVTVDSVMVDLLAPSARLLGEYWEDDRCDFVDVTMGLWRLQEVVHEIAGRVQADRLLAAGGHRALFASMPGDQHSFGTVVIDELFRCNGWLTERINEAETSDLLRRVENEWFDMVGLTISCDCHIASLPSIIVALRNVSRNPSVCVMVGAGCSAPSPSWSSRSGPMAPRAMPSSRSRLPQTSSATANGRLWIVTEFGRLWSAALFNEQAHRPVPENGFRDTGSPSRSARG